MWKHLDAASNQRHVHCEKHKDPDRIESQVKRLSQQSRELQETFNVSQDAEESEAPELAISELSGHLSQAFLIATTPLKQM